MAMPRLEEFYAFMGRKGPNERELMCELVSSPNFKLSSDSRQPTVRIRNYFVVNQYGDLASFEELTGGKVFLQGTLVSNDGMGAGFLVGHIPVRKWTFNATDDGPQIYLAGRVMHYWLQSPKPEYAPFLTSVHEKVDAVFRSVDAVTECLDDGFDFQEWAHGNQGTFDLLKKHGFFVKKKLRRYFSRGDRKRDFYKKLMEAITGSVDGSSSDSSETDSDDVSGDEADNGTGGGEGVGNGVGNDG